MQLRVRCVNCGERASEWSGTLGPGWQCECVVMLRDRGWLRHHTDWYCPECAVAARLAAESMSPATGGG